ncbi:MAG: hypothetical protein J6I69_02400 [Bacilli bacterium]|nr:hypothetical protein [Bacilli bacterium]
MGDNKYKEYLSDRKTIITIIALTIAFAITIILSIGGSFFLNDINDPSFWGKLGTNLALCVYCMYFGIPEGKDLYQKKENGRYEKAKIGFINVRREVVLKDNEFNQYLDNYYQEQKRDYYMSILSLCGSIDKRVLDLSLDELENLRKPYKKCWKNTAYEGREDTYFRALTEEQIDEIRNIFIGKYNIKRIPNDYFKTINRKVVDSEYIQQSKSGQKSALKLAILIIYRIILVAIFSFVFNIFGLEVSQATTTEEVISRIYSTLARIWTMLSSLVYGLSVGRIITLDEADKLEYKTRVNMLFISDKTFKPLSEEEIARKEYDESEKTRSINNIENNDTIISSECNLSQEGSKENG